jgi:hypothetical protein
MARPYIHNNRFKYALNNISEFNLITTVTTQTIILKIIPIFIVVFFGFLFKKANSFSYCNLDGDLCEEPSITINDKNIIETSCKPKMSKSNSKDNSNYSKSAGFIAGFSILLILIVVFFGYLAYFDENSRTKSIIVILFSMITIISFLVTNQKEIWKGNLEYVLYKGGADIFWGINIALLILLILYIIYALSISGFEIFFGVNFSIVIILLIILTQVILYGVFRQNCTNAYDYQCVSGISQIPYMPPLPKFDSKGNLIPITTQPPSNKYLVSCAATGIRHLDVNTAQIILGVLAVIIVLVNYQDLFRTGAYLLDDVVDNDFLKGSVSLIYLSILVLLIVLTFK